MYRARKTASPAVIVLGLSLLTALPAAAAEPVNRVILRVNEKVATLYDYLERRAAVREEILRSQLSPEERDRIMAEVPRRVMRDLFQELLVLSRAEQMEIYVTEDQIQQRIAELRESMGFESQAEMEKAMEDAGVSEQTYREQIEIDLAMNEVIGREVSAQVEITDEDVRRAYRENLESYREPEKLHPRDLVVLDSSDLSEAERDSLAEDIRRRLRAGEDIAAVAEELAGEGKTSGVLDLGWVKPGDLDADLEAALWVLEPGQVSEPTPGRGGVHVLLLLEQQEARVKELSEVRDEIFARERNRRFQEAMIRYLDELEGTAYVVENVPEDAAGFRTATSSGPVFHEPFKILGESAGGRHGAGAEPPDGPEQDEPQRGEPETSP